MLLIRKFGENNREVYSDTEGKLVQKIDGGEPSPRQTLSISETINDFEEVDSPSVANKPKYTESEYKQEVSRLIHEKYSYDDEIAILANFSVTWPNEDHQAEHAAYQAYREKCKLAAKENLEARYSQIL